MRTDQFEEISREFSLDRHTLRPATVDLDKTASWTRNKKRAGREATFVASSRPASR
jgi:hypothetical protein